MNPSPRSLFGIVCLLATSISLSTALAADPSSWTVTYELSAKSDIAINPSRLFHGPAAVVAPNGDWLVCYQNSFDHGGTDGVISQMRSRDEGKTWRSDGIVFDERKANEPLFGRNPAYGVTSDGRVVLVVQRWRPLPPGVQEVLGESVTIHGSVYLTSRDNGKKYSVKGLVDPEVPLRHQGTTSAIIRDGDTMLMAAVSINAPPRGISLYRTEDPDKGWQFAGWIFRHDDLPNPLFVSYGSLSRRRDGSLVAQCVHYGRNFQRVSQDGGKSWSAVRELKQLRTYKNPDLDYAGKILVVHGVGAPGFGESDPKAANWNSAAGLLVMYFSPNEGRDWGRPVILNRYGWRGGGGYSASLRTKDGGLFIVFSTDSGPNTGKNGGKPDIRGIRLSDVEIRRP